MRLIQEKQCKEPWQVLVACVLLNKTRGGQVGKVLDELFEDYPVREALASARVEAVERIIAPLGLKKRAAHIIEVARRMPDLPEDPEEQVKFVGELPGCGPYAQDAWKMLILGWREFWPTDPALGPRMVELRMEPGVYVDHHGHVFLTLVGDEKRMVAIGPSTDVYKGEDGVVRETYAAGASRRMTRRLLAIDREEFNRCYRRMSADPSYLAKTWITSRVLLTQEAREVVMRVMVINRKEEGIEYVGKYPSASAAHATVPQAEVVKVPEGLEDGFTMGDLTAIYNQIVGPEHAVKKFEDKKTAKDRVEKAFGEASTAEVPEGERAPVEHHHVRSSKDFPVREGVTELKPFRAGSKMAKLVECMAKEVTVKEMEEASGIKISEAFCNLTGTLPKHGYATRRSVHENGPETWIITTRMPEPAVAPAVEAEPKAA